MKMSAITRVGTSYGDNETTTSSQAQRQEGAESGEEQEDHRPHAEEDAQRARQAGGCRGQAQAHRRVFTEDEGRTDEDRPEARPRRALQDGPPRAGEEARREVNPLPRR